MVGKFFKDFFMFLINGERGCHLELFVRGCFERNGSAQNGSKGSCKREAYPYPRGTVPYRTVPNSRANQLSSFKYRGLLTMVKYFFKTASLNTV